MDLTFRVVRDLFSPEVEEFLVDSRGRLREVRSSYVEPLVPAARRPGQALGQGRTPIFEATGIEKEIEKALRRRVWLKSGGYIVIDQTEALVAIDVNTGKYVGKRDLEETILKINLEAVDEVVRQIRLRDLGGIIIIDFIDMERAEHREPGLQGAQARAGRGQGAHQRARDLRARPGRDDAQARAPEPARRSLTPSCPTCKGSGVVKSDATLAAEIFRTIQGKAAAEAPAAEGREIVVRAHPDVAGYLEGEGRPDLERLQTARGEDHRPAGLRSGPARGVRAPRPRVSGAIPDPRRRSLASRRVARPSVAHQHQPHPGRPAPGRPQGRPLGARAGRRSDADARAFPAVLGALPRPAPQPAGPPGRPADDQAGRPHRPPEGMEVAAAGAGRRRDQGAPRRKKTSARRRRSGGVSPSEQPSLFE